MGSIETLRWNRIGAFDKFLKAEEEKERVARGEEADEEDETDGELDPDMVCPLCVVTEFDLMISLFSLHRRYHSMSSRHPLSRSLQIRSRRFLKSLRHVDALIMNESDF